MSMSMMLELQVDQSQFADEQPPEEQIPDRESEGEEGSQHGNPTFHEDELNNQEHEDDPQLGSAREKEGYSFTFQSTYTSPQRRALANRHIFDPSLSPFANGEPSHSTLHGPSRRQGRSSKPGLQLFRSTYDTYTREHLSALVDSIAIEESPSPDASPRGDDEEERWQSDGSPVQDGESGPSGSSGSRTRSSEVSDARSSKRMRLSPSSPARKIGGVRDWDARARVMMDKIRDREVESTTSASYSQSSDKDDIGE